ncbi:MAG: hypothetical protein ACE5OW_00835 [Candidatus Bathyarchaeia archaeon]
MSTDITEKEVALVSAAIAAYLAKPGLPRAGPSEEAPITQPITDLGLLLSRVAELEKKIDKLDRNMRDLRRRMWRSERYKEVK